MVVKLRSHLLMPDSHCTFGRAVRPRSAKSVSPVRLREGALLQVHNWKNLTSGERYSPRHTFCSSVVEPPVVIRSTSVRFAPEGQWARWLFSRQAAVAPLRSPGDQEAHRAGNCRCDVVAAFQSSKLATGVRFSSSARSRTRTRSAKDLGELGDALAHWGAHEAREGDLKRRRHCTPIVATTNIFGVIAQW
jgi:hypothetical protein